MKPRIPLLAATLLLASAAPAGADGYVLVKDDRDAFGQLLNTSSTVVDSGGAFAPDPVTGSGQASVLRTGTVGGVSFTYRAYDVDFSSSPTGTITPGVVGGDIADLDTVTVESPAAQSGAVGAGTWGLDSASGSTSTRNALLLDFGPGGASVGHFGVDLLDWEASAATPAEVRLYSAGSLVFSQSFDWGADDGNGVGHFLGVAAMPTMGGALFDQAVVVVGDDGPGGGGSERWAADRFTFGEAVASPEPGTIALVALGLLALLLARRRALRAA